MRTLLYSIQLPIEPLHTYVQQTMCDLAILYEAVYIFHAIAP